MKKILMIATLFRATLLRANGSSEYGQDQFMLASASMFQVYGKSMELCNDKGYPYFVFRHFKMTGPDGLMMELQGPQNLNGDLIQETVDEIPGVKVEFEIYCFREKPDLSVAAMDVAAFQERVKSFQQSIEKMEGSNVIEVSTVDELNQYLKNSDLPVFVDFYSESCPPYRNLAPQYDQFSIDFPEKGVYLKVNIGQAVELSKKYEIKSIPTLMIFEKGEIVRTASGLSSILDELRSR